MEKTVEMVQCEIELTDEERDALFEVAKSEGVFPDELIRRANRAAADEWSARQ